MHPVSRTIGMSRSALRIIPARRAHQEVIRIADQSLQISTRRARLRALARKSNEGIDIKSSACCSQLASVYEHPHHPTITGANYSHQIKCRSSSNSSALVAAQLM